MQKNSSRVASQVIETKRRGGSSNIQMRGISYCDTVVIFKGFYCI